MKIMMLAPCLMLPNNREINKQSILKNSTEIPFDEVVIYAQCFEEEDKSPGITYIGNVQERSGWVKSRNALLTYFYNSDFDYAFWIDANSTVSSTTLNDVVTIVKRIQKGELSQCDSIFATLGIQPSGERAMLKQRKDYKTHLTILPLLNPSKKTYNWMHGLFHKNFKKYYGVEFYMDERCNAHESTAEDVYFSRVLRKYTASYLAPTIVINKPSSKYSTWVSDKGSYNYPPTDFVTIDKYIFENSTRNGYKYLSTTKPNEEIVLERDMFAIDKLTDYKPRKKKQESKELVTIPDLF